MSEKTRKTVWFIEEDGQISFIDFEAVVCSEKVADEYWRLVEKLVDGVGLVESRKKLRKNFEDSATRFKVQDVMNKYYDGKIERLESSIRQQIERNRKTLAQIDKILSRNGLNTVTQKTALAIFLKENRHRKTMKRIAERNRRDSVIMSLDKIIE